eukprot:4104964-Lingulodinium_polyedra.AAC.1
MDGLEARAALTCEPAGECDDREGPWGRAGRHARAIRGLRRPSGPGARSAFDRPRKAVQRGIAVARDVR